jgi:hypothetical protein
MDVAVEAFGASNVEADNEVWPDFHPSNKKPLPGTPDLCRNPRAGPIFPISSSLVAGRHPASTPQTNAIPGDSGMRRSWNSKKLAPSATRAKVSNRL